MNWSDVRVFANWEQFRDGFYYPEIVGRAWNKRQNTKMRRGSQNQEQEIHDLWREKMGFDAPWTDVMLFYDYGKVIALGEIKRGDEGWASPNKKAAENCALRLGVPLVLVRFINPLGPIEVQVFDKEVR